MTFVKTTLGLAEPSQSQSFTLVRGNGDLVPPVLYTVYGLDRVPR